MILPQTQSDGLTDDVTQQGRRDNVTPLISEELTTRFEERFRGFDQAYGVYRRIPTEANQPDGKKVGSAVTETRPVTLELYRHHLQGTLGLGIVPIQSGDRASFGTVDIDQYDGLDHFVIAEGLGTLKLPLVVCRSKSGGAHVYLFARQPVPAAKMVARLREVAAILGFFKAEIFPKQTELTEEAGGNWVNLPYFGLMRGMRYAINPDNGDAFELEEFLDFAEIQAQPPEWFDTPIEPPIKGPEAGGAPGAQRVPRVEESDGPAIAIEQLISEAASHVATLGGRNAAGLWLACQLRDERYSLEEAEGAWGRWRVVALPADGTYTEREFLASVRQAYKRPPRQARNCKREITDFDLVGLLLNDQRFTETFAVVSGDWIGYDEIAKLWVSDAKPLARRAAMELIQTQAKDATDTKSKARWRKVQSDRRVSAALNLCEGYLLRSADEFDTDPTLLNTPAGVVDLNTGIMRPHRRGEPFMKITSAGFNPEAKSKLWEQFLREVLVEDEVISYLQKAVGYSLSGRVDYHRLHFIYGPGRSGKSTFIEAVMNALGSYGKVANFKVFVQNRNASAGSASPELARLKGARLVSASESESAVRLDSGRTKQLTGDGVIECRGLYLNDSTYIKTWKVWWLSNYRPDFDYQDTAMLRRLVVLPFKRVVAEGQERIELPQRLRDAAPAILAWGVEGYRMIEKVGFNVPVTLIQERDAYQRALNPLAEWLEGRTVFATKVKTATADLYKSYTEWFGESCRLGEPLALNSFVALLHKLPGVTDGGRGTDNRRRVVGIALLSDQREPGGESTQKRFSEREPGDGPTQSGF